jgi:hypothetical protein
LKKYLIGAALACMLSTPALAGPPGMAGEVYGATVEKGEKEFEARYGILTGGPAGGEDALKLEAAYGVTDHLRIGVLGEFGRDSGTSRKLNAAAIEAIYALGKTGGIDFAVYGEYEFAFDGPKQNFLCNTAADPGICGLISLHQKKWLPERRLNWAMLPALMLP